MSCDYEIGSALITDRIAGSAVEETRGGRAGQSYQRVIDGRWGGGEKSSGHSMGLSVIKFQR